MSAVKVMGFAGELYPQKAILNKMADARFVEAFRYLNIPVEYSSTPAAFPNFLKGILSSIRLIRKNKDAHFIVWGHHLDSNRWLQLTLFLLRKKYVIAERSMPPLNSDFSMSKLTLPLKKKVVSKAFTVVLNSIENAKIYDEIFCNKKSKLTIIPNGVDQDYIAKCIDVYKNSRDEFCKKQKIPAGLNLICLGRLSIEKNHAIVLEAFATLIKRSKKVINLIMIGEDGGELSTLKRIAAEKCEGKVIFKGYQKDTIRWLSIADVFILPSFFEGMSRALLEAMAAEVPCIVTDIPGNRDLIINRQTGLLVPVNDENAIVAAIEEYLNSVALAGVIKKNAFEHVQKKYSTEEEKKKWLNLFKEFI